MPLREHAQEEEQAQAAQRIQEWRRLTQVSCKLPQ